MRNTGEIERLARGIYIRPGLQADLDLIELALRSPRATLCFTTALARHSLSDDIPPTINAAIPRSQRAPRTTAPVTWHRFNDQTFDIGREHLLLTDNLSIGIYSPIRSIIDAYRLRHLYGIDQAHDALKKWLRIRSNQPTELLAMTKDFPAAEPTIRTALQTLL